ncbi:MAG TPA: CoA transferase [Steroidobacteraceae bacterium]|nr:CoA transferase [Steroidobacteraceae bacterium]
MNVLEGTTVVALDAAPDATASRGALVRLLQSFGARVLAVTLDSLEQRLSGADFLIDRVGTHALERAGFSRARLEAQYPSLIHVSVTPFGSDGPRAHWRGSELVASAMGGTLRVTGDPDRAPVKEALDACGFHADMAAAAGAMAAFYERSSSGLGQHVDVSIQEVAFSRNVNGVLVWQFDRRKLHRVGGALNYGRATVRCIWPLADGFCFHSLMTGRFGAPANQALSDWIDESGLANPLRGTDWTTYNRSTLDPATRASWEAAIEAFFRTRTRAEIASEGRRRGINATVVAEPADVLADPHLAAREFWVGHGAQRRPGRFVRFHHVDAADQDAHVAKTQPSGTERGAAHNSAHAISAIGVQGSASARSIAGADTPSTSPEHPISTLRASSSAHTGDASHTSAAALAAQRRPGPLAGVRVLDFSWALVGSITTKILGDLGCDVIKIESRTRPCLSRLDVQVTGSRADRLDDKPWFAHLNTSKRSLALDLKQPASREVLNPLLDWADVIVENFSPGTMAKLGLDYERLAQRRPELIMVSGSVFGQTGPLAQEWGVDGTGAALSGRTFLTGWPDRDPVIPGAVPYGDVIVPYVMAAAAAAALTHRRATGRGCHIDAAMYEICVQQMYDAIAAAAAGARPARTGNDDPSVFHQGVYPTAGDDRWIAITLHTEADWRALCQIAQMNPSMKRADRDTVLADWTRTQSDVALAETLQTRGIAAGVVQDIEDLIERDPQIAHRGALTALDHPHFGSFGHVRTPFTFSRSPVRPYRAPKIGEHNEPIARELCALTEERLAELAALGVFR